MSDNSLATYGIIFGVIAILFAMFLVITFPIRCSEMKYVQEGFEDSSQITMQCPNGTRTFYDVKGNINCCRGVVNGNICEGKIDCTFSSNLLGKYPQCNTRKLQRKYRGQIDMFVRTIFEGKPELFDSIVLPKMKEIGSILKADVPTKISEAEYTGYMNLVREEDAWNNAFKAQVKEKKIGSGDASQYVMEEVMYIIQQLGNIFAKSNLINDKQYIQQHIKREVCKV